MSRAVVSAKFDRNYSKVRLAVSKSQSLSNPIYSDYFKTRNKVAKLEIRGLEYSTQYYYGIELGGHLQEVNRGRFRTFPQQGGPASFTCAFASCANTGSTHKVFADILDLNPLFFVHMGDIHYEDISVNDVDVYHKAYDDVFDSTVQQDLYKNVCTPYIWSDHDYGPNDADWSSPGRDAARLAYRQRVPHHPLAVEGSGAVYHSFVCGRIRFIVTDLYSERNINGLSDTDFSDEQMVWLKSQFLMPEPLKIWVRSDPWSTSYLGSSRQQKEIGEFIKSNSLEGKVAIIAGDMHALAIDDGTNGDFAKDKGGRIPVFQAAPMDKGGSVKGGPYNVLEPFLPSVQVDGEPGTVGNQYGVMNITDEGGNITVEWVAMRGKVVVGQHIFIVGDDTEPPIVVANPVGGTYVGAQSVILSANEASTIYYTMDGSVPTTSSQEYKAPISLTGNVTLKYFAKDLAGNTSEIATQNYNISPIQYARFGANNSSLRAPDEAKLPNIMWDEMELDVMFDEVPLGSGTYWTAIDGAGGARYSSGGSDVINVGSEILVDGEPATGDAFMKKGQRVLVRDMRSVPAQGIVVFSGTPLTGGITGNLYSIKLYLGGNLVAHFDMTTGSGSDLSGNGHTAVLRNAEFI